MKLLRCLILLTFVLMIAACAPASTTATPLPPTPTPVAFQPTLGRALSFLARRYDPAVGLLRESASSTTHWLAPDNLLALQVFDVANANDLDAKVQTAITQTATTTNGLLESLTGVVVAWPPHTLVERDAAPEVKVATYTGDGVIEDWQQSGDLLLYGALNAWNQGDHAQAHERYNAAMATFDGAGFKDKAFDGQYATGTLALAVYVGRVIGEPVQKPVLDALLKAQGADGGFAAHYGPDGVAGDVDTATTAMALLALYKLR